MKNRFFAFVLCAAAALLLALSPAEAARTAYPVTIDNGDRQVTFEKAPERVVTNGDGNIIEQGKHDELLKQNGFYTELYNSQFAE